jgi:O-antigen ligase
MSALYGIVAPRTATFARAPFLPVGTGTAHAVELLAALVTVAVGAGAVALTVPLVPAPQRRRGGATTLALAGVGSAVVVSGWWNGVHVTVGLFALPLLTVAVAVLPRPPLEEVQRVARWSLRAFVWGSLVAAVVASRRALGPTDGVFDLVGTRLSGLTPHPNALGPMAVALVVLEWTHRPRRGVLVVLPLVALAWTQSKTSWLALAVAMAVVLVDRIGPLAPKRAALAGVAVAAFVVVSVGFVVVLAAPERMTRKGVDTVATFTGRTAIWEATIEVWQAQPVLGVGPRLWDQDMDRRFAHRVGFAPGHAHNQLIHTLGESGLVGAGLLVVALAGMAGLAGAADRPTHGAGAGLLVLLVVNGFSEPPLRSLPFSTGFFLVVTVLAVLVVGADRGTVDGDG